MRSAGILRREGHYSSHLTAWRKARHDGIILGLAPKKWDRKPARRHRCRSAFISSRAKWPAREGVRDGDDDPGVQGKDIMD